jgi:DNA-binding MarR family transcriptional regulator
MNVRDTSIMAYKKAKEDGTLLSHRQRLLATFHDGKAYTRSELAELTGIRLSSVCGAVHTMVKRGLLDEGSERPCKITGHLAHVLSLPTGSAP